MATAVCYEKPTRFSRYTVNAGVNIPKGTVLKLVSPNYATAASLGRVPVAGISWMEKPIDVSTEVVAALDGVWGLPCSSVAAITPGLDCVIASGSNIVRAYVTLDREKGYVMGKFLTNVSTTNTVGKVRLNI